MEAPAEPAELKRAKRAIRYKHTWCNEIQMPIGLSSTLGPTIQYSLYKRTRPVPIRTKTIIRTAIGVEGIRANKLHIIDDGILHTGDPPVGSNITLRVKMHVLHREMPVCRNVQFHACGG